MQFNRLRYKYGAVARASANPSTHPPVDLCFIYIDKPNEK